MGSKPSVDAAKILETRQRNIDNQKRKEEADRKIRLDQNQRGETELKKRQLADAKVMVKVMTPKIVKWLEICPSVKLMDFTGQHNIMPFLSPICYQDRKPVIGSAFEDCCYSDTLTSLLKNEEARNVFLQGFSNIGIECVYKDKFYPSTLTFTIRPPEKTVVLSQAEKIVQDQNIDQDQKIEQNQKIEQDQNQDQDRADHPKECAICASNYGPSTSMLPCMHVFCTACIDKLKKHACPKCRQDFIKGSEKIVYL